MWTGECVLVPPSEVPDEGVTMMAGVGMSPQAEQPVLPLGSPFYSAWKRGDGLHGEVPPRAVREFCHLHSWGSITAMRWREKGTPHAREVVSVGEDLKGCKEHPYRRNKRQERE